VSYQLTLGSLFDGSGGFPLAAKLSEIKPIWASEIEPFCIRVTTKRLPEVAHLGDIHHIDGGKIEPVDIITFGSPCTDMSVAAARRAGLQGKQSSLFFEAIRIIQEMREASGGRYPRFIVWENVPGAFSSNHREDFRAVLSAIVQIAAPDAEVPAADKGGWPTADILVGDGWSVAYRVLAAESFGVAQRRHRIYLVADFDSERAGEVLFEPEGVRRDFTTGVGSQEDAAGGITDCTGSASGLPLAFEPGAASRLGHHVWTERTCALCAHAGGNIPAVVYDARGNGGGSIAPALVGDHENRVTDYTALAIAGNTIGRSNESGGNGIGVQEELSYTLTSADRHGVMYAMTTGEFTSVHEEQALPFMAHDYKDPQLVNIPQYTIRRLIPCECALLQGFPVDYCDGLETPEPTDMEIDWWAGVFETYRKAMGAPAKPKNRRQIIKWLQNPHTDSAEYKMWGNGVSLPVVVFVLRGITELVQNEAG
jgi:DNA (cytosine-5)-methyltransferase 1